MKYPKIGPLTVLQSNAGYYIGRLYYYSEDECVPYSRESTYYQNKEDAKRDLINKDYIEVNL